MGRDRDGGALTTTRRGSGLEQKVRVDLGKGGFLGARLRACWRSDGLVGCATAGTIDAQRPPSAPCRSWIPDGSQMAAAPGGRLCITLAVTPHGCASNIARPGTPPVAPLSADAKTAAVRRQQPRHRPLGAGPDSTV